MSTKASSALDTARLLLALFTKPERRMLGFITAGLLIRGILETFAVATVMPFIAAASDPALRETNAVLLWIDARVPFEDDRSFLIFLGVVVLGTITLSNLFSAFTVWVSQRFVWRKYHDLSFRLLERYVHQPYAFFLGRNTSELSKNVFSEATIVVDGALVPLMQLLARGIVAMCIIGLLTWIDWVVALAASVVLGGTYALIYAVVRRRQGVLGADRLEANRVRYRMATEALEGIKAVKVVDRESDFLDRFREPSDRFARHTATDQTVAQLPRFALEVVAFGGLLALILVFVSLESGLEQVLPLAALYAVAGYKLMPSLQLVFQGLTSLRFSYASVRTLHTDLLGDGSDVLGRIEPPNRAAVMPSELREQVVFDGVEFTYPDAPAPALHQIDLSIPQGSFIGFVGHTGSGKSTVADLLLGLLEPTKGDVLVDGRVLAGDVLPGWRATLGYVPQEIFLYDESVRSNVAFGVPSGRIDDEAVVQACKQAEIHEFVIGLPDGYDTIVGERGVRMSGGQRQRLGIARALYDGPSVLVLDEATSALDGATEESVMSSILELSRGRTVVVIAHRHRTVKRCDRIYLLEQGRIVDSGGYDELLTRSAIFREMAPDEAGGQGTSPQVR